MCSQHPRGTSPWCPPHLFEKVPFPCSPPSLTPAENNGWDVVSQKRAGRSPPAVRLDPHWDCYWASLPSHMVLDTQCWSRAYVVGFEVVPAALKAGLNFISRMMSWFLLYSQSNCVQTHDSSITFFRVLFSKGKSTDLEYNRHNFHSQQEYLISRMRSLVKTDALNQKNQPPSPQDNYSTVQSNYLCSESIYFLKNPFTSKSLPYITADCPKWHKPSSRSKAAIPLKYCVSVFLYICSGQLGLFWFL